MLSVVLFHAGAPGFSGGYVGVDVFFVISGYLITSILLADFEGGRPTLRHFYERRARRILPALLFVLLACLPAAWLWLPPHALAEFGASVGYACAFVANLFFYKHSDYFAGEIALKPLAHIWSLAVEEQYYLLFPVLLLILSRLRPICTSIVLTAIAVASLLYAQGVVEPSPQAAFYLLPPRAWELLLGALLALRLRNALVVTGAQTLSKWTAELGGLAGIGMIFCAVLVYDKETAFPGFTALLPVVGAALVIGFVRPHMWVGRVLASRPLVFIGLISYSTYLWHQPLLAFLRHATTHQPGSAQCLWAAVAALMLGYLSWRFVERPFRQPGRISSRTLAVALAVPAVMISLAGWTFYGRNGFETYYYANRATESEKRVRKLQQTKLAEARGGERHADDGACRFRAERVDDAFRKRFAHCAKLHGKAVIVLGDSHGMNIHNALHGAGFGGHFLVGLIKAGCRADNQSPSCPYSGFERFVGEHREEIRLVMYHQSGSYFIADPQGHVDSNAAFATVNSYSLRLDQAVPTMRYLDRLVQVVPTVWLGPFTEARVELGRQGGRDAVLSMNPVALSAFVELDSELLRAAGRGEPKWHYISLLEIIAMDSGFLIQGDCLTFQDKDHLSGCGEGLVGERLAQGLRGRL